MLCVYIVALAPPRCFHLWSVMTANQFGRKYGPTVTKLALIIVLEAIRNSLRNSLSLFRLLALLFSIYNYASVRMHKRGIRYGSVFVCLCVDCYTCSCSRMNHASASKNFYIGF